MTQSENESGKIAELNQLFRGLDENGQGKALHVLRSLHFAQSVMATPTESDMEPQLQLEKFTQQDSGMKSN